MLYTELLFAYTQYYFFHVSQKIRNQEKRVSLRKSVVSFSLKP